MELTSQEYQNPIEKFVKNARNQVNQSAQPLETLLELIDQENQK